MALTAGSFGGFCVFRNYGEMSTPMDDGPLAANQTIYKGDPLTISSGLIARATATSTLVIGFADEAKTSGASVTLSGDRIRFIKLNKRNQFVMNIANGATDYTSAQANIGVAYGIVEQGSGKGTWTVDISNTTQKLVRTIDWAPAAYQKTGKDVVVGTTINPAVIVEICDAETVNQNT